MDASSLNQILHSFEIRDDRMSLAEGEMKRLNENFLRLREDLLPIFRMVKESKPLPTPDLPLHVRSNSPPVPSALSPSPTYYSTPSVGTPQLIRKASKKSLAHHAPTSAHSPSRNSHDWLDTTSFYSGTSGSISKDSRKGGTSYSAASAGYGNGQYSGSVKRQDSTGSTHHPEYSITSASTPSLSSSASIISVATSSTARTITPTLASTSGSIASNSSARNVTPTLASTASRSISSGNLSSQNSLKMSSNPAVSGLVSNGGAVSVASSAGAAGAGGSSGGTSSYVSLAGSKHSEPIKDFNISPDVPCYKVLPLIARRHKVRGDWRGVGLVVCYDDQERMIGLEEKPLAIYKELQQRGKNPIFMIREDNGLKTDSGFVVNGTPGGLL